MRDCREYLNRKAKERYRKIINLAFATPQILIFNQKNTEEEEEFFSYSSLGLQHFLAISARKNADLDKLSQKIIALLPDSVDEKTDHQDKELKLLIFGPPNSGKSTLMNYLLQENRSLATPIAGTTQEPVIKKKEQEAASERRKKILTEPKKELEKELRNRLKSLSYVPIIFLSALQGTGMKALLKVLKEMLTQAQKKVSKKELAEIVEKM
ncbi:21763_t:CDS:2, partial [Racocetra persica]